MVFEYILCTFVGTWHLFRLVYFSNENPIRYSKSKKMFSNATSVCGFVICIFFTIQFIWKVKSSDWKFNPKFAFEKNYLIHHRNLVLRHTSTYSENILQNDFTSKLSFVTTDVGWMCRVIWFQTRKKNKIPIFLNVFKYLLK